MPNLSYRSLPHPGNILAIEEGKGDHAPHPQGHPPRTASSADPERRCPYGRPGRLGGRGASQPADFLKESHRIAAAETLISGATRDRSTRAAIEAVDGAFDAAAPTQVWDNALRAQPWDREPAWYHGDLHTGSLLALGGQLSTVIGYAAAHTSRGRPPASSPRSSRNTPAGDRRARASLHHSPSLLCQLWQVIASLH
ncbi:phosphotransferase [Streptomyces prunicolor]